jgi:hypothetical protein
MGIRNLSLLAGVGAPVPVPPEVADALDAVEIVSAIGERGSFQLFFRLDRSMQLPAQFLTGAGDLVRVLLVVGSGKASTVAMDGVVVEHRVSAGGRNEKPTLAVGGEDLTRVMDLNATVTRSFPAMPVNVRVQILLASYALFGVTPLVIPPPLAEVSSAAERIPHQQGSDYAYIRFLADSVGHRFTLDPGPVPGSSIAYWGPEPRGNRAHPSLVIDFQRPSNVDALELRFDAMQRVAPDALVLDQVSKTVIPVPAPDISVLGAPLGRVVPPAHRRRRLTSAAKLTVTAAASALLAKAARSSEATTGRGHLRIARGQERLRAGSIVEVRRAPDAFNGLFAVARVRDTITASRHRQEFELLRVGLGAV